MNRLVKIIIKLILSIAGAVAILYKFGDTFSEHFGGKGVLFALLGSAGVAIVLVGMMYTAITIFVLCFANHHFTLFFDGLPIPFVMKTLAGIAGIFVWIWFASFLGNKFGNTRLVEGILLFGYYPMFLWIDLFILFIEKLSKKQQVEE